MSYPYWTYSYFRDNYRHRLEQYGIRIITEPVEEQITLDQARLHLRLDSYGSPPEHADDPWILDAIPTAREWCENEAGRSFAPKVLELTKQSFPCQNSYGWGQQIALPLGPIAGVESVTYLDSTGAPQVLVEGTDYLTDFSGDPGYVYPVINSTWPVTAVGIPNIVRVRYHAGNTTSVGSPDDLPLPKSVRSAMLLVLAYLYENRENSSEVKLTELPLSAWNLLKGTALNLGMA